MDELQAGVEQTLAVPPQPSVFVQPSESAFDDPAIGHDLEGVQLAAPGNLHRDALIEDVTHALRERLADVASIGQQTLYLRQVRLAALKRLQRSLAIGQIGRAHRNRVRQPDSPMVDPAQTQANGSRLVAPGPAESP